MQKAARKHDNPDAHEQMVRSDLSAPRELSLKERQWLAENAEAIRSWNDWIEKNGLPLEGYRMF